MNQKDSVKKCMNDYMILTPEDVIHLNSDEFKKEGQRGIYILNTQLRINKGTLISLGGA